jgi:hypothetical protein
LHKVPIGGKRSVVSTDSPSELYLRTEMTEHFPPFLKICSLSCQKGTHLFLHLPKGHPV